GDVTEAGIVQKVGTIGADPYYDATTGDPTLFPGNQVDLYHIHVADGNYSLIIDVSAGRIGSPLNPGVSLFRYSEDDHLLHFVAGNDDTLNTTTATDGSPVLLNDSALFVSLPQGGE